VEGVRAPVFRALLHFAYADALPDELEPAAGGCLEPAMAQHLLAAADRYALPRLRRICERRLCETVEASTAATTLALAEQNHAAELKRVCMEYTARHLRPVMASEGYAHMIAACPQLQAELLAVVAERMAAGAGGSAGGGGADARRGSGTHRLALPAPPTAAMPAMLAAAAGGGDGRQAGVAAAGAGEEEDPAAARRVRARVE